ncbi:DUF4347 domain-containing protein, partial [Halomonas sp. ISL-56]|uniref:DUF4347 domain-containing protein n=1 Tax=Halomonas sp. ISL-56 TaxID=2819149 RepID=UPI001BE637D8
MTSANQSLQIAVIDRSVSGYHSLVDIAQAQGLEVVLLSGFGDGFIELAGVLEGRADVDSLHLFSHGSVGRIQLGQAYLSASNLDQYSAVLEAIGKSFSDGGDLLIYGCEVAGNDAGLQLIEELSLRLDADVAASDNVTGTAELSGDWVLEIRQGNIESTLEPDSVALKDFRNLLSSTVTVTFDAVDIINKGGYGSENSGKDVEINVGGETLVIDGDSSGVMAWDPDYNAPYVVFGDNNSPYTDETKLTFSFLNNTAFSPESFYLYHWSGESEVFTITSDKGHSITTAALPVSTPQTVGIGWTDITKLYMTSSSGGFRGKLDSFVLSVGSSNNAPVFINSGPFSIAENSANGTVVGDVNANDGDGGAEDANVIYSIVSGNPNLDLDGNSAFAIDANTGAITLNDTDDIDYEVATSHTLTISATDQNSATTNQSVTINVTDDEGDNPPMLNPGDMAVLGWNALNDTITFTTLVDLPAGTVIKFTDKGWDQSTNAFTTSSTGDGVITWTVGSPINAGGVFELFMGGSDEVTTLINKTANVDLTADIVSSSFTVTDPMNLAGDSVFIYQGADSNPLFIFGMNNSGGTVDSSNWNTSIGATLRDSMLPDSTGSQNTLTNGTNAIGLPGGASQLDNVQYTGPTGIADKVTWLVRISDAANWTGDNTGAISTSAGSSVQIGVPNEAPVFATSSKASVAENTTAVTTLVATDADGDALTYS